MTISARFSANENASAILAGCGFSVGQKTAPTRTNENAVIDIRPVTASIIKKKARQIVGACLFVFTVDYHKDSKHEYTPTQQKIHCLS